MRGHTNGRVTRPDIGNLQQKGQRLQKRIRRKALGLNDGFLYFKSSYSQCHLFNMQENTQTEGLGFRSHVSARQPLE